MPCANAAPAGGYSIVKKIPLPGEGSWDYLTVDEGARRLYVTHATQVQVIDIDSGSVVGTIPNKLGVHGVALATDLGKGFLSDGKAPCGSRVLTLPESTLRLGSRREQKRYYSLRETEIRT
jgi:hypothetical protein